MGTPVESKAVFVSLRCYERLLVVYPERHRRQYGFPMAQLFRDQCRDAWREARSWGLFTLWLRVLPDLVRTSFLEHLSVMKARKSMVEKISEITNVNTAPLRSFFTWFIIVFLLVFGTSALVTFLLPESFRSTARVKVERGSTSPASQSPSPVVNSSYDPYFQQTEFEVIQSEMVLRKVIEALDLNAKWGKRYADGEKLRFPEAMALLKGHLELRTIRNTTLIEISVYGEDRDETAAIANAIAGAYRDHRQLQQRELATRGIVALREQFDQQEQKVREGQKEVDALRKALNIADVDAAGNAPGPTLEGETARQLQGQLIASKTQLAKEETQLNELKKLAYDQRRDAIQTVVGADGELGALLSQHDLAQNRLVGLAKDFAAEHPDYQKAKIMADETSKRLNQRVEGIMIGLTARVSAQQSTVEKLKDELERARENDIERAQTSRPYYEAKQRLEDLTRIRSVLSLKLASEKADMSLPKTTMVEIIDRAQPSFRPVRPNKALNLFLGAVVGTLLGAMAGGAVAWGRFRVRQKTPCHATGA